MERICMIFSEFFINFVSSYAPYVQQKLIRKGYIPYITSIFPSYLATTSMATVQNDRTKHCRVHGQFQFSFCFIAHPWLIVYVSA
jgi:hypothetical protein